MAAVVWEVTMVADDSAQVVLADCLAMQIAPAARDEDLAAVHAAVERSAMA